LSLFQVFLARSAGVVLIASGIAAKFVQDAWGAGSLVCLSWSAIWAIGLGVLGFRSLRITLTCSPQKMAGEMLMGVAQRVAVLFASMGLAYLIAQSLDMSGNLWSSRSLLATTLLYLLVLGIEIVTLAKALNRGELEMSAGLAHDDADPQDR